MHDADYLTNQKPIINNFKSQIIFRVNKVDTDEKNSWARKEGYLVPTVKNGKD